jgi:hypothetical protein
MEEEAGMKPVCRASLSRLLLKSAFILPNPSAVSQLKAFVRYHWPRDVAADTFQQALQLGRSLRA